MFDLEINKLPILIVASPRTGSTILGEYIANTYNILYYNEPDISPEKLKKFVENFMLGNNFVLKIMANMLVNNQYPKHIIEKMLGNECFKIKITRKDIIEQIASFYTCRNRKTWTYNETNYNDWVDTYIDIDYSEIKHSIKWIIYQNKFLENLKVDVSLSYEDLPIIKNEYKKTPRPKNYADLMNKIQDILNKEK
jgi:LPS sulfotransferase NodH